VSVLRLAKYHGLGNDFLVYVGGGTDRPKGNGAEGVIGPAQAVALCARHTGVGADGVLSLSPTGDGQVVRMELRNADGGAAETSGNGLRCAALAAFDAGLVSGNEIVLETQVGPATARLIRRSRGGAALLRVSMGSVRIGKLRHGVLGRLARFVDVGNPHLVLYSEPGSTPLPALHAAELAQLEHGIDGEMAGGLNVEAVNHGCGTRAGGPASAGRSSTGRPAQVLDTIDMVVWERGAGATQACGSGSVAAAAAMRAAGLAGDRVEVRNPGGTLLVELDGPPVRPDAQLTGPAQLVARVEVDLGALLGEWNERTSATL
jgi:diaminopimelate epimerase